MSRRPATLFKMISFTCNNLRVLLKTSEYHIPKYLYVAAYLFQDSKFESIHFVNIRVMD